MYADLVDRHWADKAAKVAKAITSSHRVTCRVEVWSNETVRTLLSANAPFSDGEVKDEWKSGIRRSLSLAVAPSETWRAWLQAGCEIRPYRGIAVGGEIIEYPMGRFPVQKAIRSQVTDQVRISANDRWGRVVDQDFLYPRKSMVGIIPDVVAALIADVDPAPVQNTVVSDMQVASVVWDKSRSDTIIDLLTTVGAEAFIDRDGTPVMRPRPVLTTTSVRTLRVGHGGTVLSYAQTVDRGKVINSVGVFSSANDTRLLPVVVAINDPGNPAHRSHVDGDRVTRFSSSSFKTTEQMQVTADALLLKGAAPATQWTLSVLPDPSLDASDVVLLSITGEPNVLVQIQSITHPLTADGDQTITTVDSQSEDS